MTGTKASVEALKHLDPLSSLSDMRLQELAGLCFIESVSRSLDPFRLRSIAGQSVYLVRGELALAYRQGMPEVIVGGSAEARCPLGKRRVFISAKAVTGVQLIRIDDDLLDVMLTWDQLAAQEHVGAQQPSAERPSSGANWGVMSGLFGINNLRFGAFSQLPPAHIDGLLRRFERIEAKKGEVIIREGAEGDYYYLVESGRCQVERMVGGVNMTLAELKSGDTFGEEALVSEAKRNATVTMLTDGVLMRLNKQDFRDLMNEPLVKWVSYAEAKNMIAQGGRWLDVRLPSEHQNLAIEGSLNIPLYFIRLKVSTLDRATKYIVYCDTGRRSSAAAYILVERGFDAYVLRGGLDSAERDVRRGP